MDVDLLRPGTVPIAPETVLWFEFLLDQDLLLRHLQKPSSEPSPTELITKFYDVIIETLRNKPESDSVPGILAAADVSEPTLEVKPKYSAKNIALKILSLKVGAFLKWNLSKIRSLPFKTQIYLLQDLLYFTNNKVSVEIPNLDEQDIKSASGPYLFALLVYHRWLLNTSMHRITSNWQLRYSMNDMSPADENLICSLENVQKTVTFLTEALNWSEVPNLLTFDCFTIPTERNDNIEFDWLQSKPITKSELCAQINYDLGTFFFYREEYDMAKKHFSQCVQNFNDLRDTIFFPEFDKSILDVYVRACHGSPEGQKTSLLEQLNSSIVNQYMGITNILQQDNIVKEIPLSHRITLELDIQGALSSGAFTVARDLLLKIKALNIIRTVVDRKPLYQTITPGSKSVDTLVWAIQVSWKFFSSEDRSLIKNFLMNLILKNEIPELLDTLKSNEELTSIFDKNEWKYISVADDNIDIPDSLNKTDFTLFDFSKKRKPKMELKQLEQQLIGTYDHKLIRELLVKITMTNLGTSVWKINPEWELPIPLQSVLKSLPRGFLQDFAFVMLAKSKEQMLNKNWNSSLELLIILDKELQSGNGNISKLFKLVSWEILLVQIAQLLDEWPKNTVDKHALANACEACLQSDSVLPRTEITEACVVCLLNLGRWEFLINFDKRRSSFEIPAALAMACQDMVKHKGNKKLPKTIWDLVIPIFGSFPSQSKRNSSASSYHESQILNMKINMMSIFSKLKDSVALTVVISMLAAIFNILKDESSLELQVEYVSLWPNVISNANSYNSTSVCEVLSEILSQALTDHPVNVSWLRLMGDINFANGHFRVALNFYLKSLLICNDYFNIPIRNDDHVFKRMIKSCISLGCHTQAAVLCQFLEEPDYLWCFRILGDQKTCNDAVDAYYHCFWDTNILEYLIHIHNKKGEFQRRKCAVQVIGLLEINSNNNEEIQREASNLRKSTFLRALCKQYVF